MNQFARFLLIAQLLFLLGLSRAAGATVIFLPLVEGEQAPTLELGAILSGADSLSVTDVNVTEIEIGTTPADTDTCTIHVGSGGVVDLETLALQDAASSCVKLFAPSELNGLAVRKWFVSYSAHGTSSNIELQVTLPIVQHSSGSIKKTPTGLSVTYPPLPATKPCLLHVSNGSLPSLWVPLPDCHGTESALPASFSVQGDFNAELLLLQSAGPSALVRIEQEKPRAVPLDFAGCATLASVDPLHERAHRGAFSVICADISNANSPRFITLQVPEEWDGKQALEPALYPFELAVRAPIVVYVRYSGTTLPAIKFDGTTGTAAAIYVGGVTSHALDITPPPEARVPLPPQTLRRAFGPQRGATATLTIGDNLVRIYEMDNRYYTALRVGLAAAWSPGARTVGVRSTMGGGKYAAITDGKSGGLWSGEFVVGYSWFGYTFGEGFAQGMSQLHPRVALGLTAQLGVLKLGPGAVNALSSIRGGIELAYGLDFSIAVTAGANRYDKPNDGFKPDQPLPDGTTTIESSLAFTPGVGFVVTLTPAFLRDAGLMASGGG